MTHEELRDTLITKFNAFLGGSRYFAAKYPDVIQIKESTDWDFSIQFGMFNQDISLEELGFYTKGLSNLVYRDKSAIELYHHNDYTNVTVIVRSDLAAYKRAFASIPVEFYRDHLWKSYPLRTSPLDYPKVTAYFDAIFDLCR